MLRKPCVVTCVVLAPPSSTPADAAQQAGRTAWRRCSCHFPSTQARSTLPSPSPCLQVSSLGVLTTTSQVAHQTPPSVLTAQQRGVLREGVCSVKGRCCIHTLCRPSLAPHLRTAPPYPLPSRQICSAADLLVPCTTWDHGSPDPQVCQKPLT